MRYSAKRIFELANANNPFHKGSTYFEITHAFMKFSSIKSRGELSHWERHHCNSIHPVQYKQYHFSSLGKSPRFSNKSEGEIIAIRRVLNGTNHQPHTEPHTATNNTKDFCFCTEKISLYWAKIFRTLLSASFHCWQQFHFQGRGWPLAWSVLI